MSEELVTVKSTVSNGLGVFTRMPHQKKQVDRSH